MAITLAKIEIIKQNTINNENIKYEKGQQEKESIGLSLIGCSKYIAQKNRMNQIVENIQNVYMQLVLVMLKE